MGYTDPTELMVNNLELGIAEYVVGAVLLALYVCIELIAIPINIIRDAKPVHHTVVRSPEKNFNDAYKMGYHFRGEYLNLYGLPRIHYLDEGNIYSNETIVLLHGEPFWSHSWSKLIPYLTKAGYRVIAPDFIGFGKSDKFVDYRAYTVSLHKRALAGLLTHLNIPGTVTLVGHNWGWMIGSAFAKDNPGYFSRFVILNTNNVPDGEIELNRYRAPGTLPKFLHINSFFLLFNAAINLLREWFPLALLIHSLNIRYTIPEVQAMLAPHRSLEECGGTTAFPLLVPVYPNHPEAGEMKEVRHFLSRTNIPTLVAYSEPSLLPFISQGDFVVGNRQVFYSSLMHSAKDVFRIKDGGHLIMYDQPAVVAQRILQFQTKYRAFQ